MEVVSCELVPLIWNHAVQLNYDYQSLYDCFISSVLEIDRWQILTKYPITSIFSEYLLCKICVNCEPFKPPLENPLENPTQGPVLNTLPQFYYQLKPCTSFHFLIKPNKHFTAHTYHCKWQRKWPKELHPIYWRLKNRENDSFYAENDNLMHNLDHRAHSKDYHMWYVTVFNILFPWTIATDILPSLPLTYGPSFLLFT